MIYSSPHSRGTYFLASAHHFPPCGGVPNGLGGIDLLFCTRCLPSTYTQLPVVVGLGSVFTPRSVSDVPRLTMTSPPPPAAPLTAASSPADTTPIPARELQLSPLPATTAQSPENPNLEVMGARLRLALLCLPLPTQIGAPSRAR